jgi:DNA-binding MarR family transcriptional regulator
MTITIDQLVRAAKGLTALAQDIAIPKDIEPPLTPGELSVISLLVRNPEPTSIGELARMTRLAQSRVSSVVRSLLRRGWVAVTTPTHDRRATLVRPRKEVVEGARRVLSADIATRLAGELREASSTELKAIVRGLETLNDVLDRQSRME